MAPWLGTDTTLPMSWHSDATTTSGSAPARWARVAVCRQCVSWSTANPSTFVDSMPSRASTVSPCRCWLLADCMPISDHCSALDSSMRVNVWLMPANLPRCRDGNSTVEGDAVERSHEQVPGLDRGPQLRPAQRVVLRPSDVRGAGVDHERGRGRGEVGLEHAPRSGDPLGRRGPGRGPPARVPGDEPGLDEARGRLAPRRPVE